MRPAIADAPLLSTNCRSHNNRRNLIEEISYHHCRLMFLANKYDEINHVENAHRKHTTEIQKQNATTLQ